MVHANSAAKADSSRLFCFDCKKNIKVKNQEIQDGVILAYDDNGEKINVVKCNACYKENPGLRNFRKCEVYSRIVGYLRPVSQWNRGKAREYKDRKSYKISSKI